MRVNSEKRNYAIKDLENLFDSIPYAIWVKDDNGKNIYVNKAYADKLGESKEDLYSNKLGNYGEKNCNDNSKNFDSQIIKTNEGKLLEECIFEDGNYKWYETYKAPFTLCEKDLNYILAVSREVTIEKNIMNEIGKNTINILDNNKDYDSKSELGLKNIIDDLARQLKSIGISMFLYDKNNGKLNLKFTNGISNIIKLNKSFDISEEIEQKILNNVYEELIPLEKIQSKLNYILPMTIYVSIYAIKYQDELIGTLNIKYTKENIPKYRQDDYIRSVCDKFGMILKNIILSKRLKEEFKKRQSSENELELFLETATDLYAIIEKSGDFKKISNKCSKILGWEKEEILKMNYWKLVHPDYKEELINYFRKQSKMNINTGVFENKFKCKNNEYIYIEWNWSYINKENSYILTGKDITEKKLLEEKNKKLEDAIISENVKNEFFANVSHEFKTPLNIILTTMQLISKNLAEKNIFAKDSKKFNKYVKSIKQNSYRLLRLVNNLIDITKIDSGYYELHLENYNIINVIEDVTLSVAEYIGDKGVNLVFDTSEEEVILACDPEKIERIMLNLLSNAVKYTDKNGEIKVNIDVDNEKKNVVVSVKDNGVGISKENLKLIFNRFVQADNALSRRCEGSGIGLSLVKSLIELHGGNIDIKSEVGKGSSFIFNIPIKEIDSEKMSNLSNRSLDIKIEKCNVEFSDIYSADI